MNPVVPVPTLPPLVAFDLGDTLVEYEGLPLSWEAHYGEALDQLAGWAGICLTGPQRDAGAAILRRHNTRLHPRTEEVTFAAILAELALVGLGPATASATDELAAARAFFGVFRQRLRAFPDAAPTLDALRRRGSKIAVFTDVPYGMPRELVHEDVALTDLAGRIDLLVTSRDAGCRKPAPAGLAAVANALGSRAAEMIYVGNERKDILAALAFGCRAVALDRGGQAPTWGQHTTLRTLTELLGPAAGN